jgi:hypothetical protein
MSYSLSTSLQQHTTLGPTGRNVDLSWSNGCSSGPSRLSLRLATAYLGNIVDEDMHPQSRC